MKSIRFAAALALGAFVLAPGYAQTAPAAQAPAPSPAAADLKALISKVQTRMMQARKDKTEVNATTLAAELAEFDALLAKYPEKTNDAGQIALWKGLLYLQVLNDEGSAKQILTSVAANYPDTPASKQASSTLFSISPEGKAKTAADAKAREEKLASLVGSPAPELNFTWTSRPGFSKLSDLKGQVVVLDFWATWCGPCIGSFPSVREHVAHFKGSPVTVLGVTSIQGRVSNLAQGPVDTKGNPSLEMELMNQFMKEKDMTWDVAFSKEEVFNPDYAIRGIPYVAIVAPDGKIRHAGLHPGRKDHDIAGKVTEILKEFNLPVPTT